jgi:hypothetical protein
MDFLVHLIQMFRKMQGSKVAGIKSSGIRYKTIHIVVQQIQSKLYSPPWVHIYLADFVVAFQQMFTMKLVWRIFLHRLNTKY